MRSLSIQVQPERSPDINIEQVCLMCEEIAKDGLLVKHHQFDHGVDNGPYFNFTFGTDSANKLWSQIRQSLYEKHELGAHMRKSSMAMCSSEEGWHDYLLLYHFDPEVKLDSEHNL